jgi:outer membrane protein TolC
VDRRETNSTFARFNPDFSSDISLTGSQPLLRGFGRQVNLAPIARAQLGAENALWQMREAALDILRDVELAYWNLSLAQARLRLRESSVELAETLLEENRERAALGLESELAVLQAEAGLAERREEQIVAHQAVERASDRLHRVMGTLEVQPVKLRAARFPRAEARAPDYDLVLKRVLEGDIQSRIRTNRISQEELDLLVARDRARPNLEASFSAGYLGRSEEGYEAFENTLNRDGYRWRGDLRLSLPLGLREGRARRRQAFLSLREEEIAFELYRQDLLEETRMLFRSVTAGIQRIEASKAAFELNQLTFEQTRAEYEEGLSSFRAVLEAQQDLEEARLRDLEARVDLLRARVRLSRLDNTLLERHGFRWEEIDEPSRITASPIAPLPDENGHEAR